MNETPTPSPLPMRTRERDEVTSRSLRGYSVTLSQPTFSLRDPGDPRKPRSAVKPLPPVPRKLRFDETPTAVERPPVELSRPEEEEGEGLGLDRPLFSGNTDVVDTDEYERLVSTSAEEEDPELEFDQAPTPIAPLPTPIPPPPAYPSLEELARRDASVELVFSVPTRTPAPPVASEEPTPIPPHRARVATPYAVGVTTDRGLPAIQARARRLPPFVLVLLGMAGATLVLGLVALIVFLVARG